MNFNKLLIVPFLAFAVTACGNDCKSTCEDANDCAGRTTKANCDDQCDKADQLADDSDCGDQYDDYMSCLADQDDICKITATTCSSEATALGACVLPYCMKSEHTAQCQASGLGGGADDS